MRRKKVERKDKPSRFDYLVVREDDVRIPKYRVRNEREIFGVTIEHARRLAARVEGQTDRYVPLELEVYRFCRDSESPITASEAHELYREREIEEEEEV